MRNSNAAEPSSSARFWVPSTASFSALIGTGVVVSSKRASDGPSASSIASSKPRLISHVRFAKNASRRAEKCSLSERNRASSSPT